MVPITTFFHSCRLATCVDVCPVGQALLAGPEPCSALCNVSSSSVLDTSSVAARRSASSLERSAPGEFLTGAVLRSLVISTDALVLVIHSPPAIPRRSSYRTSVRSQKIFPILYLVLFRSKKRHEGLRGYSCGRRGHCRCISPCIRLATESHLPDPGIARSTPRRRDLDPIGSRSRISLDALTSIVSLRAPVESASRAERSVVSLRSFILCCRWR